MRYIKDMSMFDAILTDNITIYEKESLDFQTNIRYNKHTY